MKRIDNTLVIITFAVAALIAIIAIAASNLPRQPDAQLKVALITSALGGVIAVISACLLLFRAAAGFSLTELLPLVLPLLAGVLITSVHWSTAIALGVIGAASIIRGVGGFKTTENPEDEEK